jgi:hypothetical protein
MGTNPYDLITVTPLTIVSWWLVKCQRRFREPAAEIECCSIGFSA